MFLEKGFTLIELMIAVAIVGILAAIAYPAYRDSVLKARRTDGTSTLLNTAQLLERCFTQINAYNDASCTNLVPANSPEGHYAITIATPNATSFTLTATPNQTDAQCGILTLNQANVRTESGSRDVEFCW